MTSSEAVVKPHKNIARPKGFRAWVAVLTIVVSAFILLGSGITYYLVAKEHKTSVLALEVISKNLEDAKAQEAADLKRKGQEAIIEAQIHAQTIATKLEEDNMRLAGYEPSGTGLYFRWADRNDFTCGYWSCAAIEIMTGEKSCPRSVYVEANVTSGGVAVGFTNGTLGGLTPYSNGVIILEDHSGAGDGFKLTEISCH